MWPRHHASNTTTRALTAVGKKSTHVALILGLALTFVGGPTPAAAQELELDVSGKVQTDLRFRVEPRGIGGWWDRQELPVGLSRNENILKLRLNASVGMFRGVADVDLVFYGRMGDPEALGALSIREELDPYRLEAHELFIEAIDVAPGLDIRIGQQVVMWGEGDQFNPTNVLNADDLEDPLLFGEQQGNLMLKIDYTFLEEWTISGVLVPIFRPALLPRSGSLALAATERLPFTDEELRWLLHSQKREALTKGYPTVVTSVDPDLPEISLENMQFAFRIAGVLGEQDISLMYYRGFHDIPVPTMNYNRIIDEPRCRMAAKPPWGGYGGQPGDPAQYDIVDMDGDLLPDDPSCIKGYISNEVHLEYPGMHMVGFNMAGEIPVVGIGYRLEVGVFFPEQRKVSIIEDGSLSIIDPVVIGYDRAGYDYDSDGQPGGPLPTVVESTPFAKWSLGLDYTIAEVVYLNVQWIHGLVDEWGAGDWITEGWSVRDGGVTTDDIELLTTCAAGRGPGAQCAREMLHPRIADYLVLGVDFRFDSQAGLFRFFTIWDLSGYTERRWDDAAGKRVEHTYSLFTPEGFSAVIYPELQYNFGYGFELHAGALIQLGRPYTRFGDPAAGGSEVFLRGRYSF